MSASPYTLPASLVAGHHSDQTLCHQPRGPVASRASVLQRAQRHAVRQRAVLVRVRLFG